MAAIVFLDELYNSRILDAPFLWRCSICTHGLGEVGSLLKATPYCPAGEEKVCRWGGSFRIGMTHQLTHRGVWQQLSWLQLGQLLPAGFEYVPCEWMFRKGFLVTELLWQFPMASVSSERLTAPFRKFVTYLFLLFLLPRNPTVNSAAWMLFPSSFSSLNRTHSSGPNSSPISSPTRHLFWVSNCPMFNSELSEPLSNFFYVFWF